MSAVILLESGPEAVGFTESAITPNPPEGGFKTNPEPSPAANADRDERRKINAAMENCLML